MAYGAEEKAEEAGQHRVTGIDQIFEMFANKIGISQVVVLPDQGIEEFLSRRSSNLSQFDRCKICQGTNYRGWLKIEWLP